MFERGEDMKINKERFIEMIPMMILVIIAIVTISMLAVLFHNWIQFNDELVRVEGEVLEKSAGVNYIFIVKNDNGHIVKFTVEFEEYFTYDVGSHYSGDIRRGNIIEGP